MFCVFFLAGFLFMAVPNTFQPNTQIKSAQVNENFTYITNMIDKSDGHVVVTPDADKFFKFQTLRQDDTSNTYVSNQVVVSGWGWVAGDGVNPNEEESVSFGVTFATRPIVVVVSSGANTSSNPTHQGDTTGTTTGRRLNAQAREVTTTGFNVLIQETEESVITSGTRCIYQWIAIGTLS